VSETKKAINAVCRAMGREPMYRDVLAEHVMGGAVRRDRYYGRPLATVAQEFLESRKEACSPDEIFEGLKSGAFDFRSMNWGGSEKDWIRNLSISLAKNTKSFHRLPNGTYGLVAWYSELQNRRDAKKAAAAEQDDDEKKASPAATGEAQRNNKAPEENAR
jgi:hypothetical protein